MALTSVCKVAERHRRRPYEIACHVADVVEVETSGDVGRADVLYRFLKVFVAVRYFFRKHLCRHSVYGERRVALRELHGLYLHRVGLLVDGGAFKVVVEEVNLVLVSPVGAVAVEDAGDVGEVAFVHFVRDSAAVVVVAKA